ncbi:MAG: ATP-dependent RecD-like DNA helicase [Deltaproteobacteria bacterium]|nr:ATP-dependent RecD-like DNA helicase [Deltaproteobacteria bacterium]MBW2067494.1 ATP-dependent RecD-like DNA helicase [Deltaproteobacteria bacterium]
MAPERLRGEIERITFVSQEDGYAVVKLRPNGSRQKELVTVTGHLGNLSPGESLEIEGHWTIHEKYGKQFVAHRCISARPSSIEGMRKYLASGLIRGIGPVIAERIVNKFGTDTLDILEHDIDRLKEVEGIGPQRLQSIKDAWEEHREIRELMQFLQLHGVSTSYAYKIFKRYGKDSVDVIKSDPYRLAIDVAGIGFITADRIAQAIGIPEDSIIRAKGAIFYMLHELASEGHVCYPSQELIGKTSEKLNISDETIRDALSELIKEQRLVADQGFIYLPGFHKCEIGAAEKFMRLYLCPRILFPVEKAIDHVERKLSIKLDDKQKEALKTALTRKVTVITGGPGTGKTTLVKAITMTAKVLNWKVLLAAPTGRAAKRLEEATGHPAMTIHRLLEYSPASGGFQKNENNHLKAHYLIVDEASMLDLPLFYHLLKALPNETSLLLVGDVDQLPSVGPGNVLRNIIDSGIFPVVKLNTIYRQARNSAIVVNAHRIREGKFPLRNNQRSNSGSSDFYFIVRESPEDIQSLIVRLCVDRIPAAFGLDPVHDIHVLTPMNKGILGTANLNRILQDALNPTGRQIERGGMRFREGDRVMQVRNNYEKEVFNGDIGRIEFIDEEAQQMVVSFDNRPVIYEFNELDELSLAYAISIHKAQGSEYPAVIMPVVTQHFVMLQRNLIYTGVTRGRKLVVMIGTYKALAIALNNTKLKNRYGLLRERLLKIMEDLQ